MGFDISNPLTMPKLGVTVSGVHVTIKGSYVLQKQGASMVSSMGPNGPIPVPQQSLWTLLTRVYVYGNSTYTDLTPLVEDSFMLPLDSIPSTPCAVLYAAIKSQMFSGHSAVDVL